MPDFKLTSQCEKEIELLRAFKIFPVQLNHQRCWRTAWRHCNVPALVLWPDLLENICYFFFPWYSSQLHPEKKCLKRTFHGMTVRCVEAVGLPLAGRQQACAVVSHRSCGHEWGDNGHERVHKTLCILQGWAGKGHSWQTCFRYSFSGLTTLSTNTPHLVEPSPRS